MARLNGIAQTAEVALSAGVAKTVLQIAAPANQQVALTGWGIFFDGISPTAEPVQVEVMIQTTAGTMTSLTPRMTNRGCSGTLQTTAQHTATAEPTAGDVMDPKEVHPQAGYEKQIAPYSPQEIVLAGGNRLGIKVTSPTALNCRAFFTFEE